MISKNYFIIIIIIILFLINNKEICNITNETFNNNDNDNDEELKNKLNNFDFIIKYNSFN